MANALDDKTQIVISATFTADLLSDGIDFWSRYLSTQLMPVMAPYAQLFQQLLDPASALRSIENGAAVLCVRLSDLAGDASSGGDLSAVAEEFAEAVLAADITAPMLILLCPEYEGAEAAANRAFGIIRRRLGSLQAATVIEAVDAFAQYNVGKTFDPDADRIGHIPYTSEAFAVIATTIVRWRLAALRRPVKMIAVDCDNTLWRGVIGEDGADGVVIGDGHLALHQQLAEQTKAGRILTLASKNEEADVISFLQSRSDLPLSLKDILAHRINWAPKSENIKSLAEQFEIGLDACMFLDDSPMECAEMRAQAPDVLTVRVPAEDAQFKQFVEHLWLFDQTRTTDEDRARTQMYRESAKRNEVRSRVGSLAEFIATLDLKISIEEAREAHIPRLAQLTQRTNQFNANLLRLTEAELFEGLQGAATHLYAVSVSDRFGDYGVVGAMRGCEAGNALLIDLFMLSCRALGRGVEHQMLSSMAELAAGRGLKTVEVDYRDGPRNTPALSFLESVFGASEEEKFSAPAETIAALELDAAASSRGNDQQAGATKAVSAASSADEPLHTGLVFERIAHELTTAQAIVSAMTAEIRERPNLAAGYVAPGVGLERDIAAIWEEVLQVQPVGVHDGFTDLGGKSIHLVRIHALMVNRLGLNVDLTSLFQHGTVALLAKRFSGSHQSVSEDGAALRAAKMRAARTRHAGARRIAMQEARR